MGGQVQVQVPEAEVQRRLLAQISSRGVLKPGHRFESSSLGNTLSDTGTAASFGIQNPLRTQQQQQQQQQQMVAELVSLVLHSCLHSSSCARCLCCVRLLYCISACAVFTIKARLQGGHGWDVRAKLQLSKALL